MAAVFVLFWGRGDEFMEVDVPAPARVCDVRKALREPFQLSGLQVARTELRVVAAGGPQPAPGAVSAALAAPRTALDASAPLGSPAAGFGAGAWLVAREVAPQHDAPAAGEGAPLSATAMVGPTFEAEARVALEAVLPEVFPWLRSHSRLMSRQLELPAEGTREADLLCYTDADSLRPSVSSAVHGVRLIELGDGVVKPPCEALPIPAGLGFSPADRERSGPHKYILGEVYSGALSSKMEEKVRQLNTLVSYMLRRWNDRSPEHSAEDVTQLVGAGVLVFCAGTKPRRQVLDSAAALVAHVVAGAGCPSLRRLAHAGRLVVMVLEQAQCPLTTSQRAVAERLDRNSEQLAKLTELPWVHKSTCAADLRSLCNASSPVQSRALLYSFSPGSCTGLDPAHLTDMEQDVANFLLVRGPYAWLGSGWSGCDRQYEYPAQQFNADYGEPSGVCRESAPGSGVFVRDFTRSTVQMDCATWTPTVTFH